MGFPDSEFDITPLWEKAKGLEDWTEVLRVKKGAHNDLHIRLR